MLVGFTGIKSNSVGVDTIGNNLANLNTTAFKSQRTLFETQLYQTISSGQAPNDPNGGTSPRQIGYGSSVSAIQRNFGQGGIDSTGIQSDLAINGDGLFILQAPNGELRYTRNGAFQLDQNQTLVSANGTPVQVFGVDQDGVVQPGPLTNLNIALGSSSQAIPTTSVVMDGNLDSATNVASQGAVLTSQPMVTASGQPATATTALTNLVDVNGLPMFETDDVLKVNASKGGIGVEEATFIVGTTGTTLGDFAGFMDQALGINTDPATGGSPGVSISDGPDPAAGTLVVSSNFGEVNGIQLDASSITNTTGAITSPFTFAQASQAVGGGVTTSFNVFDSLGNEVDVRLRAVLESKSDTGSTWRIYSESSRDTDLTPVVGTGTITFDANGQFVSSTGTDLAIDLSGAGATTPLAFSLDMTSLTGLATTDGQSKLIMDNQDGAPAGILTGYSIDTDGTVAVVYSNQLEEVIGQVALATFRNNEGLVALGDSTFIEGPNSGIASVVVPQTEGAGAVLEGRLEGSNVEIAREFVNLIQSSTGISSASRVVRVADELLQELLLLAR